MAITYTEFTRRPGADRNEMALAALNFARALRRERDDIESARYFWIDWNTIAMLTEGGPGHNVAQGPNASLAKASAGLFDLADRTFERHAGDADMGQQAYEIAGRPGGN